MMGKEAAATSSFTSRIHRQRERWAAIVPLGTPSDTHHLFTAHPSEHTSITSIRGAGVVSWAIQRVPSTAPPPYRQKDDHYVQNSSTTLAPVVRQRARRS